MKRTTAFWLVTATVLVLLGAIVFGGSLMALHFDFSKLTTTKHETNTHALTEEFHSISVKTKTADVTLVRSEDGTASVVCEESVKEKHEVSVENGTLTVTLVDTRKWYEYVGFFTKKESVTIYLPKGEYDSLLVKNETGSVRLPEGLSFGTIDVALSTGHVACSSDAEQLLRLKATTGRLRVSDVTAGAMELKVSTGSVDVRAATVTGEISIKVSTGDVELSGVRCGSLASSGSTGEIELENVLATGRISIERSTGDVELSECDAGELYIKTDTGDVEGTLLSDKIFMAHSDTGRVRVPKTTTGGICEVTTDTGSIKFEIAAY